MTAAADPPDDRRGTPPRGVYVVVEGLAPGGGDPAATAGADKDATRRRLRQASREAGLGALPACALLASPLVAAGAWALTENAGWLMALLWSATMAAWAATLLMAPRLTKQQTQLQTQRQARRESSDVTPRTPGINGRLWPILLGGGSLLLGLPLWWASPGAATAGAAALMAWAVAAAAATAPWRAVGLSLAAAPLHAAAAAAAAAMVTTAASHNNAGSLWPWAVGGAFAAIAAAGTTWTRHEAWMRSERRLLTLESRNRLLTAERDQAVNADSEKSRFVAIASHDLRQPVHALGLFAATLQKRLQHTPEAALVRHFLRAVDDLERSFSAMLDISRLDGGAMAPRMHTFPLRDLFRRLHMQYAGQAELAGLGLRFSTGGKSVTSDPQLLERIVGNLVQNALKYTAQGGVVVVARSTGSHINVEIWDTGIGMAPAELPRVFQEFYQLSASKRDRSQGLGMGLAIVKRLAGLLGHRLEVRSVPGRGTMFRVGIPLGALPGIQDELAPADTVPMTVQTPQMVLIVDDEEPIREGLRLLLQEWGYQTMTAANAAEADEAVQALEGRIDLVLSDIQLDPDPEQPDGLAVVDSVRRLCGYAVPAVLVTGDTSPHMVQGLAARGDPVLFKPVQPRRLVDALRAALH